MFSCMENSFCKAKFYGVSTDYLLGLTEQKITQTQSWTLCIWVMMQSKY